MKNEVTTDAPAKHHKTTELGFINPFIPFYHSKMEKVADQMQFLIDNAIPNNIPHLDFSFWKNRCNRTHSHTHRNRIHSPFLTGVSH